MEFTRIIFTWLTWIYVSLALYPYIANFWKWVFKI